MVGYFVSWRTMFTRDREIVEAMVRPEHRGPSAALSQSLRDWPGTYYWTRENGVDRLVLIRGISRPPRERWWLHAVLFLVTFVTVAAGGALLSGGFVPLRPAVPFSFTLDSLVAVVAGWVQAIRPGVNFAMALMAILLVHECGHYFTAQRYLINASPPYFLPAPYQLNVGIGTFGAFIRLRSPVADRRQLMDVGAAGPWAGFIVAFLFLVFGLLRSSPTMDPGGFSPLIPVLGLDHRGIGDSLLTYWLRHRFFGDTAVMLHPVALAGWFGGMVTGLNLLPIGQLDGGHVLYSMLGRRQGIVGIVMWLVLFWLGVKWFLGWLLFAMLILVLSRGRLGHPSVVDPHRSIPLNRKLLGLATILLFLITFTPVPIYLTF